MFKGRPKRVANHLEGDVLVGDTCCCDCKKDIQKENVSISISDKKYIRDNLVGLPIKRNTSSVQDYLKKIFDDCNLFFEDYKLYNKIDSGYYLYSFDDCTLLILIKILYNKYNVSRRIITEVEFRGII